MRRYLFTSLLLVLIFASWSMAAEKIIVITAVDPPGAPDKSLMDHVAGLGFDVEAYASTQPQPVDTSGAIAVVIGEALSSSNILGSYKDVAVPLVIAESYILDEMQLAVDGSWNLVDDMTIVIVDPAHPIAGGMTGEVQIASQISQIVSTSDIQGDVNIIANTKIAGDACIATYETGALGMDGVPVPAPRVLIFLHENMTAFVTDDGWKLVERSVLWAVGAASVAPEAAMATTWGDLKALYQ